MPILTPVGKHASRTLTHRSAQAPRLSVWGMQGTAWLRKPRVNLRILAAIPLESFISLMTDQCACRYLYLGYSELFTCSMFTSTFPLYKTREEALATQRLLASSAWKAMIRRGFWSPSAGD